MDLKLKSIGHMSVHVYVLLSMATTAMYLKLKSLAHMCVHVDVLLSMAVNNSNGPEAEAPCPHVRPCGCAHMYVCAKTAMDLKLKPLAHICVHVDLLLGVAVQQQQWT